MTSTSVKRKDLTFFWIQSGIMEFYGSFLLPERNTRWNRIRSTFNTFIYPPMIIPLGYSIWISYPDIPLMCSLLGIITGFVSSSFKLPTFHFRIRHFIDVRNRVLKLYERVQPGEEEYLEKIVKFVQKLALANGVALVFGSALLVGAPPLYAQVLTVKGVENVTWPTPYDAHYFLSMESRFNYRLVNVYCFYTLMLCVLMNNCIDCVFFESCMVVAAHFRIIQNRLKVMEFGEVGNFQLRLLGLIQYQKEVYELASQIQRAYCTILCPFFVIASLMSCAEFYTATVVRKKWTEVNIIVALIEINPRSILQQ